MLKENVIAAVGPGPHRIDSQENETDYNVQRDSPASG